MEKSISSRYYLDYNATSPLSKRVIGFLQSGDFIFGNPSSLHSTGKKAKKFINETSDYLFNLFQLPANTFELIYHSGASEGINSFFKGIALYNLKHQKKCAFFFSTVDHSAVINLEDDLKLFGHEVYFFQVDKNGEFDQALLIDQIKKSVSDGRQAILNFTYINNETGVVWPLEYALKIKKETNAIIHVDAVQLVGKIIDWNIISSELDAYTFSGHKFGAMKSIGFSFIKKSVEFLPLIVGGGQQDGNRAGTENALGIYSLKLALQDVVEFFNPVVLKNTKEILENLISRRSIIVGSGSAHRNLNTIFVVFKGHKATDLSISLDMQGLEVSTGSACSSGIVKKNRLLLNMGFSDDESLSTIRFSFSPILTDKDAKELITIFSKVLAPYL